MIHVLIIEDDPMVQFIHKNYLEKMNAAFVMYSASSIKEANKLLDEQDIQLILLDIHLEDGNGLQLLTQLRKRKRDIDVILITAAKEAILVKESLHLGVLDYLIKPFTYERFEQSLELYRKKSAHLAHDEMKQEQIDAFLQPQTRDKGLDEEIEKGITQETLALITEIIQKLPQPFTIQDVTENSHLSHVSVRKYMAFLEKTGQVRTESIYLKVGRPYKVYFWQ